MSVIWITIRIDCLGEMNFTVLLIEAIHNELILALKRMKQDRIMLPAILLDRGILIPRSEKRDNRNLLLPFFLDGLR